MPYEIRWYPRYVVRRYYGHVTGPELVACLNAVCADARFDDLRASLSDYREANALEVGDEDIEMLAAVQIGALRTNATVSAVAVATDPRVVATLVRIAGLRHAEQSIAIQANAEAAVRWLAARSGVALPPLG